MADAFDPYHKWLGIPPAEQPANHYRLLAIAPFEDDAEVIEGACDQRMAHVRTFQTGPHSALSQQVLNELAAARVTLLNLQKKAAYDEQLKQRLAGPAARDAGPAAPPHPSRPIAASPVPMPAPAAAPQPIAVPRAIASEQPASFDLHVAVDSPPGKRSLRSQAAGPWAAVFATLCIGALIAGAAIYGFTRQKRPAVGEHHDAEQTGDVHGASAGSGPSESWAGASNRATAADERESRMTAPQSTRAKSEVDLLQRVDPARDAVYGTWEKIGGAVRMPATAYARLEIPFQPPQEYELMAEVKCVSHAEGFCLGLAVGDSQTMLVVDGGNQTTWLDQVDESGSDNVSAKSGQFLRNGRPNTIVCTVRKGSVRVDCNGERAIDWTGEPSRLSVAPWWRTAEPRRLYLGTLGSSYTVSKLKLRPLGPATSLEANSPSDGGAAANDRDGDGFVSLFNGKDLSGWKVEEGGSGKWSVERPQSAAVIVGRCRAFPERNYLLSERNYADFILRFEFLRVPGVTSAVTIRATEGERLPFEPKKFIAEHPIFTLSNIGKHPVGTTYWIQDKRIRVPPIRKLRLNDGAWHNAEIVVRGDSCKASFDGQVAADLTLNRRTADSTVPALNRVEGKIGFQIGTGTIRLRAIKIKELPAE